MKKILTLVLVSALGGILTLGGYKLFVEKDKTLLVDTVEEQPTLIPTTVANTVYNPYETPDFTTAAENTVNAVVHVKNVTISNSGPMSIQDFFMGRSPQREQTGTGSGVIISPDGYIITNNHVIDKSQKLSVTLNNNKTYEAEVVGADSTTDIALLKIDADEELPVVTFGDSDNAKIGEWVLAVGNPFNLTSTVTAGIISAKSRNLSSASQSFIQTDAAVNPGNSGGALVNVNGELIGINTAISSQTGSYIGYSFAVPSNIARKVVNDIIEFGNVQNGILGVTGIALNSSTLERIQTEKQIEIEDTQGFYVDGIEEDSGAEAAGLKEGDIIKKVDDIRILKFADLKGHLNTKSPGNFVDVTFLRDGNIKTVPVKLVKPAPSVILPYVGQIKNAKPKDLKKYSTENGVKISILNEKYSEYWTKNGIEEGSIITAVNDENVNSVDDVKDIIENMSTYDSFRLELINKDGEKERYNFR